MENVNRDLPPAAGGRADRPSGRRAGVVATMFALLASWSMSVLPAPAAAQFYREAPELAERVARGALPPADQRLPGNPLLLQTEEEIGRYGGVWRMGMVGKGDGLLAYRSIGYEDLMRWDPTWRRVVPNVAQSVQVSDDARVFTFRLRQRMRWSDGEPFTAEDIRFWFEDVLLDPELTPEKPSWLPHGNGAVELDVLDADTVRFRFAGPNSLFLEALAQGHDHAGMTEHPRHALKRYHKRYNPDGIDEEVRANGVANWVELFHLKAGTIRRRSDPESLLRRPAGSPDADGVMRAEAIPTLNAWMIDRIEPGTPPRVVAVRNPYYWKVDRAGNQLPYIDRVEFLLTDTLDNFIALLRDGVVGMQARHVAGQRVQAELPSLIQQGYRTFGLIPAENNMLPIVLNLTHVDPARRALFSNREFRVALSHAINRHAIIEKVYHGEGEPYQNAPRPESRFFSAKLAHQHIAYDPAQANAMLDAQGLFRRDGDGIRLTPDGRRVAITVLTRADRQEHRDALEMVAADWKAVGVDATIRTVDRSEINRAIAENRFDMIVGPADGGIDAILEAHVYMPLNRESVFAPAWVRWLENPKDPAAQEPPVPVADQLALYARIKQNRDPEVQEKLMREILDITAAGFYTIGISTRPTRQALVRPEFRNVRRVMPEAWVYPTPAPTNPAQYFVTAP